MRFSTTTSEFAVDMTRCETRTFFNKYIFNIFTAPKELNMFVSDNRNLLPTQFFFTNCL